MFPDSDPAADPAADPAKALLDALMAFRQAGFRHHAPGELGRTEFAILMTLDHHSDSTDGGMRVSDLARILGSSPPTMTQSTGSLTKLGFVERMPDPADRRVIRISLTPVGRAKVDERRQKFHDYCGRMAGYLGTDDALTLARLLTKTAQFMQSDPLTTQKENRS